METIVGILFTVIGIILGMGAGWMVQGARLRERLKDSETARKIDIANQQAHYQQELSRQQEEIARLKGQLENVATAQQILETAKIQFGEAAKLTAAEALQSNNKQFLELSEQNLGKTLEQAKSELEQRHQQFQELVKPLSENYGKLNPQIEALAQQNQSLAAETGKLSSALTDVRQVGHWGEVQLKRVVEMANMIDHCDFSEQKAIGTSDRPDLIVRLPEGRKIVVDAKASISAAIEAKNADDEAAASAAWAKHAGALKSQVNILSGKNYGSAVEGSLDFVVMFVPGDQFLSAALKADPSLVNYAMSQRIAIATPSTLIAMLWAVNSGWQNWKFAQNAEEIRQVGIEMHDRLQRFLKHYGTLQQRLTQTVKAFDDSVGTLERSVLVSARRMAELRGLDTSEISEPSTVKSEPRPLKAIESGDNCEEAGD